MEFVDEAAARRFDLDPAVGESGRPSGGDVTDAGPWVALRVSLATETVTFTRGDDAAGG